MSDQYLNVTKKGERLIASKFGIPYGLFLAYIDRYWWVLSILCGVIGGFASATSSPWLLLLVFPVGALQVWAQKHFEVKDER